LDGEKVYQIRSNQIKYILLFDNKVCNNTSITSINKLLSRRPDYYPMAGTAGQEGSHVTVACALS